MNLVPATGAMADKSDPLSVTIDPAARRIAGIATVKAQRKALSRTIHTVGSITSDGGLVLDLFPEDVPGVRYAQRVTARPQALLDETIEGRAAFLDLIVDPRTRTVRFRVDLVNPEDSRLLPGDYAKATLTVPLSAGGDVYDAELAGKWISPTHPLVIRDEPGLCPITGEPLVPASRFGYADSPVDRAEVLVIPRSAVLAVGDTSVAYVEEQPGRFELRRLTLGTIVGENAVVLSGVEEGEEVATSGNFLIDSQMQLAGKPSLIDPDRAGNQGESTGPILRLAGDEGRAVEHVYAAYLAVQDALASDRPIDDSRANELEASAAALADAESLPEPLRAEARSISGQAKGLSHLDLAAARVAFQSISASMIRLASHVRGDAGRNPFFQFHCPMVPSGGGDWLQDDQPLRNPYFGAAMSRCGKQVREFSVRAGSGSAVE